MTPNVLSATVDDSFAVYTSKGVFQRNKQS